MKYDLIGFPKCGQHSIIKLLEQEGEVLSRETCWLNTTLSIYEKQYKNYKPVFVIRNVYDFLLSGYNNWDNYPDFLSFQEFLVYDLKGYDSHCFGVQNPIKRADFRKWIKPFTKYDPIIINVDKSTIHEFKTENKKLDKLTEEDREEVRKQMKEICEISLL